MNTVSHSQKCIRVNKIPSGLEKKTEKFDLEISYRQLQLYEIVFCLFFVYQCVKIPFESTVTRDYLKHD